MEITNTFTETVDLPSLGLVVEPGQTVTVPDDATDLLANGWFTETASQDTDTEATPLVEAAPAPAPGPTATPSAPASPAGA